MGGAKMKARVMKSVAKMRGLDSAKFYKRREVIERLAVLFVYLSVFICILCVGVISYFLLKNGIDGIREIGLFKFLFGDVWSPQSKEFGIFPMIVASFYTVGLAIFFSAILGVFSAVFLVYFAPKWLNDICDLILSVLASIPSVVYGFLGLMIVASAINLGFDASGRGLLCASIILSIMILPTIIAVSRDALLALPEGYLQASLSLGASLEYSIIKVLLRAASGGILSGLILAISRALGESMAVLMISGNQPLIPQSLLDGMRTLSGHIILEMGYASGLHHQALLSTALILFIITMFLNIIFGLIKIRIGG